MLVTTKAQIDSNDDLIYQVSNTNDDSSSHDGELDVAEPPVPQTTRVDEKLDNVIRDTLIL